MIDSDYLNAGILKEREITGHTDPDKMRAYIEGLGIDHDDLIQFAEEYARTAVDAIAIGRAQPTMTLTSVMLRGFLLGVQAGRDPDQVPEA